MIIINRSILFFCLLSSFFLVNGSFKKNISDTLSLKLGTHPNLCYFELNPTKKCIALDVYTKKMIHKGSKNLKTGKFDLRFTKTENYHWHTLSPYTLNEKNPDLFLCLKYTTGLLESLHLGIKTRNNKKWNFNCYLKNKGSLCLETNINGLECSMVFNSCKNLLDFATKKILFLMQKHNIYDEKIINDATYETLKNLEVPDKREKDKALSILRKILEKKMYINHLNKKKNPLIDLSKIIKSIHKGTIEATVLQNGYNTRIFCKKNLDTEKIGSRVVSNFQEVTPTNKQKKIIVIMTNKINDLHKHLEICFDFGNQNIKK